MKFILKNILFLFNLFFVLCQLIAYLSPYVDPQDFWPVAFFGLTYKFWLIANIFLMIIFLSFRKKVWIYNALVLLIGIQFILRNIQFNPSDKGGENFSIMVFNTRVQQIYDGGNTSEQINGFILEHDIDLAVLIEWLDRKGKIDATLYPHQQSVILNEGADKYGYGLKLVSKYPIIHWERIMFPHQTNNVTAFFDVEIDEQVIRIVATHLQSNLLGTRDYAKFTELEFDSAYKTHAMNVISKMRIAMKHRSAQVKKILEIVDESPYPVFILGDFNDTPQSFAYQKLKNGRKDAFVTNGNLLGATYMKPVPLLRIDYILYDPLFECTYFTTSKEIESDHKIVWAKFKI